ncbi:MAG: excinuclease ABC subunit UvrA [Ferruginibacter sp.]
MPDTDCIEILGAREHNLKGIDVTIPRNQLVVITGVSGSGKSSLAFDTIYNEGQRRYMESFSAYARQFVGDMERPDVDRISGLSPVISIEQKTTNRNPRSTVGTITEIYDFLRLLFARSAEAFSYETGKKMVRFSEDEIIRSILQEYGKQKIILLAPLVRGRKGHYRELFEEMRKKGYLRVRVDGDIVELTPKLQLDRYKVHDIELVVDRLEVISDMKNRIAQSVQQCMLIGKGLMFVQPVAAEQTRAYSRELMCPDTGISYEEPSPNAFSFNSPYGACTHCRGLGNLYQISIDALIPDRDKSIREGGIVPLGEEREAQVYKKMQQFAASYKIDLQKPIRSLKKEQLDRILFGGVDVEQSLRIDIGEERSAVDFYKDPFEGVVPMLKRWFADTNQTDTLRNWVMQFLESVTCTTCSGTRLKKESLHFKIDGKNIAELSSMSIDQLAGWFDDLEKRLSKRQNEIARDLLKEIRERLFFLNDVGLTYLTLERNAGTLSGGEYQRIRLATQIGSQLQGITYVLDEPSIGLHQRDNHKLIQALENLRDLGNTILVVEHDRDIMLAADYLIDVGPKAGVHGGEIVFQGTPKQLLKATSETTRYLTGKLKIPVPATRRKGSGQQLIIYGAEGHNLKKIDVAFSLGTLTVITGVSGSGKSTLINDTLYPILHNHFYKTRMPVLPYERIEGLDQIDKVIEIDQSPIGRTPRSNPATYCGFFTDIRCLFAAVPESKVRGYTAGRFSFNVKSGRCPVCEGGGMRVIEMNFLPDVHVHCETCNGKRYNRETLEIRYKGKHISEVLDMTVDEAVAFFQPVPSIYRKIKVLQEVGLGYITLGQSSVTLSGGEAQRVKLATELAKRDTGRTIYILDEPSTGLHFQDIKHLLEVLQKLVERGNTVLVIEHNLDIIKVADQLIDIGPDGGDAGGKCLFSGTPEALVDAGVGHTGRYLAAELEL